MPQATRREPSSARRNAWPTGRAAIERLDIFCTHSLSLPRAGEAREGAPINVFVHGGAWRRNKAADYALQAEPLVRAGAHCVIVDFINVDQAGGDLFPDVRAGAARLAWVWRNAESFGGDRNRLYVSAHSSGSHLSGVVLTRGLGGGGAAAGRVQGRGAAERHVRSGAGRAVEALGLCEVHRRDGAGSSAGSATSAGSTRR